MQNGRIPSSAMVLDRNAGVAGGPFSENQLMELAAELMEVANEAELENFLGKLIRRAWRGIRKVAGGVLRPLGSVLRAVAKKALPFVAGAAGTFFGGPAGGALGASLGSAISKALELEYEALEVADRELEMARSFVRLAGATARQAAFAPPQLDPQIAVQHALIANARRQLPGLRLDTLGADRNRTSGAASASPVSASSAAQLARPRSGRWLRRGNVIILIGV